MAECGSESCVPQGGPAAVPGEGLWHGGGGGGLSSPPILALSKEFYGKDQLLARLGRAGELLFSLAGREEYGIEIFFRSCARRERLWGTGAGKKSLPCGETTVGG